MRIMQQGALLLTMEEVPTLLQEGQPQQKKNLLQAVVTHGHCGWC